ncbi:hypothetical protein A2U01_0025875, partial [Trifolium medium]|nr:hypothetical protein [Trifolium medium]
VYEGEGYLFEELVSDLRALESFAREVNCFCPSVVSQIRAALTASDAIAR